MKEKLVSKAYAKAIFELGEASKVNVADELTTLTEIINKNNNLENVLFLDLFTVEEKTSVLEAIISKLNFSPITVSFLKYLMAEKRFSVLPLIFKDLIVLDDHKKGFMRGTIEGAADSLDEATVAKIKTHLKKELGLEPDLTYVKNSAITAGVRITVEDYQLDASVDKQLQDFKETIINN
ncbi:ATP synthase F1 subunit delta [Bacteriovorax sp. Seq25_V]|uniref:ATP synthase F1 subunit delta n=1 Tax=Bacteriovorax sp. Seq25_V TaxID=1201288 RepID=UPI00038A4F61|nr:ATP synthase F1 subunit delta [Bacteriovorax sp. Seq25_V]EQC43375.1 ATP synthase F1, delta subunit [Bacteriovorax sp. Seq25_V]